MQGHRDVACGTLRVGALGANVDFYTPVTFVEEITKQTSAHHPLGRDQEDRQSQQFEGL